MIYGSVPYDAASIDELLTQISQIGPQFQKKKISKKVESLIRGLLDPNPATRMSHNQLFDIVLKDPNYPLSLLDSGELSASLTMKSKPLQTDADTIVNNFVKGILYSRSKYKYLVELATKAAELKK